MLETQQNLKPPLADFGLVRRVGGIPVRIFEYVSTDDRRHDSPVISAADHGDKDLVSVTHVTQVRARGAFASWRVHLELTLADDIGGHDLINQVVDTAASQLGKHRFDIGFRGPDMPADEIAVHLKLSERGVAFRHRISSCYGLNRDC